jgi:hypothetical protein
MTSDVGGIHLLESLSGPWAVVLFSVRTVVFSSFFSRERKRERGREKFIDNQEVTEGR